LSTGLAFVTTRSSCDYFSELFAFDEVIIRMRLGEIKQNRITMIFEYWRCSGENEELVARAEQQVACMRREKNGMMAASIPKSLLEALSAYK
jgi:enediyne biosynthesis thioesterase